MPRLPPLVATIALSTAGCAHTDGAHPSSAPAPHAHSLHSSHSSHSASAEHDPLVHRFEHAEDWAKVFDEPGRDAWQKPDEVVRALEVRPGMTVADVGAGTGYFEPSLSRAVGANGHVLALDVEPDMVRHLRERAAREGLANVKAEVVRGDDPRLAPASVNRVLIVDTWHHMPNREAYARRLAAALAPGGVVVVVDFTLDAERGPPKHHRIDPEQVARELSAGGLEASIAAESLPDQYIVLGKTR